MKYTHEQLQAAVDNAGDRFQSLYLEWVNDFITLTEFAESRNLTEKEARHNIEIGRKIHNQRNADTFSEKTLARAQESLNSHWASQPSVNSYDDVSSWHY